MNNFFRRTITGAWIVILILGGFWLHPFTFFLTGLLILAGTQYEYYNLVKSSGIKPQMIGGIAAGVSVYILSSLVAAGYLEIRFLGLIIPIILSLMICELYRNGEKPFDSLAHTMFSLLYTAFPLSLFPFAAFFGQGPGSLLPHSIEGFSPGIIVGFFLLTWANDTGAYLIGITLGRHRLMEKISPKKSWEGFAGGIITTVVVAYLIAGWLGVVSRPGWIIIALIISVAGTYGDLVESMLKRSIGVKDSGSVMPGHGGFLDRFDSAVFSFPLVCLFFLLFG